MARRTEVQEFGGRFWRITEPGPSAGSRVYMGLISGVGAGAVRDAVMHLSKGDGAVDDDQEAVREHMAKEHAVGHALAVLRQAHLGKQVAASDITTLMMWLAPMLAGAKVEQLAMYQHECLFECRLQWAEKASGPWKDTPLDTVRGSREQWKQMLDTLVPDLHTLLKLSLWAFLFIARPTSAG